ncbi:MAG: discoidin domain-containing protein, partial [Planctomycetota bacterium]|nr:discoidin domain-containing protein [Planctomycetota bacterium]
YRGFEQSLSTGKPVEASGGKNPKEAPEMAADGWVDLAQFWGTIPAPQWWQVDLQKDYQIDRIHVFPYWDGVRYYQYTVEVSSDAKSWTQVVDASKNATPGTEKGYLHKFPAVPARYVKVNMLKNSDNPAVQGVSMTAPVNPFASYINPDNVPLYLMTYDHAVGYPKIQDEARKTAAMLDANPEWRTGGQVEGWTWDWMAQNDPAFLAEARGWVAKYAGRWDAGGGSYGQPYFTFISEESGVRQMFYGTRAHADPHAVRRRRPRLRRRLGALDRGRRIEHPGRPGLQRARTVLGQPVAHDRPGQLGHLGEHGRLQGRDATPRRAAPTRLSLRRLGHSPQPGPAPGGEGSPHQHPLGDGPGLLRPAREVRHRAGGLPRHA